MSTRLIVVFGSLRKYCKRGYNFDACGQQEFIRFHELHGYDMYSLGAYPAICEGSGTIKAELHRVSEITFQRINRMEIGAGYDALELDLPEGKATVYLFPAERLKGRQKVESGDWNK